MRKKLISREDNASNSLGQQRVRAAWNLDCTQQTSLIKE